ncbi:putative AGC/AKT protein kinase [Blattamonas nauphoetae]|uniref:non-specific serine/threonine protein kinase n=1 Tax=Blattamonas nauphoetae TaxID=2049346 RepID=A0ABQ9XTB7_9EUKA|nr:putative AGC/AKT protein kinase [Blattamonas nauphoetae]
MIALCELSSTASALHSIQSPLLLKPIRLFFTEHTHYFLFEHCPECFTTIPSSIVTPELSQFYIAELLQAISVLHQYHFVHRSLEPSKLFVANDSHIRLDSTTLIPQSSTVPEEDFYPDLDTTSECVAPEVKSLRSFSYQSDIWSFGILVYYILSGGQYPQTPQPNSTFVVPASFTPSAEDLLRKILSQNADDRPSTEELKTHPFFDGVSWDDVGRSSPPLLTHTLDVIGEDEFEEEEPEEEDTQEAESAELESGKIMEGPFEEGEPEEQQPQSGFSEQSPPYESIFTDKLYNLKDIEDGTEEVGLFFQEDVVEEETEHDNMSNSTRSKENDELKTESEGNPSEAPVPLISLVEMDSEAPLFFFSSPPSSPTSEISPQLFKQKKVAKSTPSSPLSSAAPSPLSSAATSPVLKTSANQHSLQPAQRTLRSTSLIPHGIRRESMHNLVRPSLSKVAALKVGTVSQSPPTGFGSIRRRQSTNDNRKWSLQVNTTPSQVKGRAQPSNFTCLSPRTPRFPHSPKHQWDNEPELYVMADSSSANVSSSASTPHDTPPQNEIKPLAPLSLVVPHQRNRNRMDMLVHSPYSMGRSQQDLEKQKKVNGVNRKMRHAVATSSDELFNSLERLIAGKEKAPPVADETERPRPVPREVHRGYLSPLVLSMDGPTSTASTPFGTPVSFHHPSLNPITPSILNRAQFALAATLKLEDIPGKDEPISIELAQILRNEETVVQCSLVRITKLVTTKINSTRHTNHLTFTSSDEKANAIARNGLSQPLGAMMTRLVNEPIFLLLTTGPRLLFFCPTENKLLAKYTTLFTGRDCLGLDRFFGTHADAASLTTLFCCHFNCLFFFFDATPSSFRNCLMSDLVLLLSKT